MTVIFRLPAVMSMCLFCLRFFLPASVHSSISSVFVFVVSVCLSFWWCAFLCEISCSVKMVLLLFVCAFFLCVRCLCVSVFVIVLCVLCLFFSLCFCLFDCYLWSSCCHVNVCVLLVFLPSSVYYIISFVVVFCLSVCLSF